MNRSHLLERLDLGGLFTWRRFWKLDSNKWDRRQRTIIGDGNYKVSETYHGCLEGEGIGKWKLASDEIALPDAVEKIRNITERSSELVSRDAI